MTILIGVKAKDGAILAADCLTHRAVVEDGKLALTGETGEILKIIAGLKYDKTGLTGAYFADAGARLDYSALDRIIDLMETNPNMADFFVTPLLEYFGIRAGNWSEKIKRYFRNGMSGETFPNRDNGYNEFDTARLCVNAGRDNDLQSLDWSHLVLRISHEHPPDLTEITSKGETKSVEDYLAIGIGKEYSEPVLSAGYKRGINMDETSTLTLNALNACLKHTKHFRGYQLVVASKGNGKNYIKTAVDTTARKCRLDSIKWLGPVFR
jgi:hypothetical protein